MSLITDVRSDMMKAMKEKNKEKKDALSALLSALKNTAIDKGSDLTSEEEGRVVLKEIRTLQETIDTTPSDRTEMIESCKNRISFLEPYAPKLMCEEEIESVIDSVLSELGISEPTNKDKGNIMKNLMPRVKGKADGKLVNTLLTKRLA